jgi:hypothetical protein
VMIGESAPSACPSHTDFFPPRAFASTEYDGADSRKANSEFLRLMSEPSLWCGQAPDEGYRVLNYFPFWGPPHPVAVRLTRTGAGLDLVAVSLAGGRDTGGACLSETVSRRV